MAEPQEDSSRAHFIRVPVQNMSPPEAGERPVDILEEVVKPEFIRSEQPEGQGNDIFGSVILMIG